MTAWVRECGNGQATTAKGSKQTLSECVADRWPEFAHHIVNHLTRDGGGTTEDLIDNAPASDDLQAFLRDGPPMDAVLRHILHLAPWVSPAQLR